MSKNYNFKPSKYQKAIYEFIQHGVGNLIVEACAGSGKTTTLIKCLQLIPENKKILFCAFNKDIVKELKRKVGVQNNVDIKTIHSLGFSILTNNFRSKNIEINQTKYREFVMNNISILSTINTYALGNKKYMKYINNICSLIDYSRYNLVETHKEINILVKRYEIDIFGDEIDVVIQSLQWGKENITTVDYGDMVWLPNVLYLKTYGFNYDYVFVDEAQDLSVVQRELLMKCQKMGTRYAFFGDENQSIYSFAGADIESFRKLKQIPNTTYLPLSISYRCAQNIVRFAQNYVKTIEPNEDGRMGEVIMDGNINDVKYGDMIVCRNNAPLIKIYCDLIKSGKKCHIKGKEIGSNLIQTLDNIENDFLNTDLQNDGVFSQLYQNLFETRNNEMLESGLDENSVMNTSKLSNMVDVIRTLETLAEGINTKQELKEKINEIYSDDEIDGISLSTIHKAKGLEAKNVFIACPSLMPRKTAKQKWEKEQENNLMYVAFTRAKDKLVFLNENGFDKFIKNNIESIQKTEKHLNDVLKNNTKLHVKTVQEAFNIIKNTKKVEINLKTTKTTLSNKSKTNSFQTKRLINKNNI